MAAKLTPMKIKRLPLEKSARTAISLTVIAFLAMWLGAAYYSPNVSVSGLWPLLPAVYTAIMAVFLIVLNFRYALLEKYPYLINLPSFVYRLAAEEKTKVHGKIINKIFTVWCVVALWLSAIWTGVVFIVFSLSSRGVLASLLVSYILIMVALLIITVFALYRSIYRSFAVKS